MLPDGTGEPDQSATLANTPVISGTVKVTFDTVVDAKSIPLVWEEIDDLFAAASEVPSPDRRTPPGERLPQTGPTEVFLLDPEAGQIRFGDGVHGRRPPAGARIRATYEYSKADLGNVGPGSIKSGAGLPPGIIVTNPVRTWGGSKGETVAQGEKQIAQYVQHRDRPEFWSD